jgi:hypothetical protein
MSCNNPLSFVNQIFSIHNKTKSKPKHTMRHSGKKKDLRKKISLTRSIIEHRWNKIQTSTLCMALAFRTMPRRMLRVFKCISKRCIFIFTGHLVYVLRKWWEALWEFNTHLNWQKSPCQHVCHDITAYWYIGESSGWAS